MRVRATWMGRNWADFFVCFVEYRLKSTQKHVSGAANTPKKAHSGDGEMVFETIFRVRRIKKLRGQKNDNWRLQVRLTI